MSDGGAVFKKAAWAILSERMWRIVRAARKMRNHDHFKVNDRSVPDNPPAPHTTVTQRQPMPPKLPVCVVGGQYNRQAGGGGGAGWGKLSARLLSLPEESERDSEPDDAGFLQLLAGMVSTAAGSTQSGAGVASGETGETHCALLGLAAGRGVCAAAVTLPLTFSRCLLAEKLLHIQSWMMMELRLPNRAPVPGTHWLSHSSSWPRTLESQLSLSPGERGGAMPRRVRVGDMGGVGSSSNFFHMSSLGAVDL